MSSVAAPETPTPSLPRIGELAPDFTANSTHGELKFSTWQGNSWVILFSHPADFTPICATEMNAFAKRNEEFAKRNVKLLGLSIDSIHAHMAWLKNIKDKMGVELPFPLIADNGTVAEKYGMLHPNAHSTATVRALFIIDPKRTVRALIYYPLTNGRNIEEVLRLVDAIQTTTEKGVVTPANWKPGDKVIVVPPLNAETLKKRESEPYEFVDFYLAYKQL
jgi:peroxiredoxin (alkyl hydroperoxide reductase subunit C)